jgi:hypothetical protein
MPIRSLPSLYVDAREGSFRRSPEFSGLVVAKWYGTLPSAWIGRDIPPPSLLREGGLQMTNLKLLVQELRDRAEEALTKAETFRDPEAKRLMRQIAANYEEVARRIEREADGADKA